MPESSTITISIVFTLFLNYNISKRVSIAANLLLQSGQVTSMPEHVMYGKAMMGYSNRNEYRLPYYPD